jgi:hypothetical protein
MNQFAVQAVCDETELWSVMQALEQHRCLGILVRPMLTSAPAALPKRNGHHKANHTETVLAVIPTLPQPFTTVQLRKALQLVDSTIQHNVPYQILHILKTRKILHSVKRGQYRIVKGSV